MRLAGRLRSLYWFNGPLYWSNASLYRYNVTLTRCNDSLYWFNDPLYWSNASLYRYNVTLTRCNGSWTGTGGGLLGERERGRTEKLRGRGGHAPGMLRLHS